MFLTIAETCKMIGCSYNTLVKFKETGYLVPALQSEKGHDKYSDAQIKTFIEEVCHGKMVDADDELLNVGDVKRYTGLGTHILNRLEDEGELLPCRQLPISNKRLYCKSDVDLFLERHGG